MRLRTIGIIVVILALLATMVALGIAGAMATRDGWFEGLSNGPFGGRYTASMAKRFDPRSFDVTGPLTVDISIDEGRVRVVSVGATATVVVTPTGSAGSRTAARAALESIKPEIQYGGGILSVIWHGDPDPRPRRFDSRTLDVFVQIPTAVSTTLSIETRAADIAVRDIRGSVMAATAFGDLELANLTGAVQASTSSGNIEADNVQAGFGKVVLRTEFGDVRLNVVRAASVRAESSSGDIVLARVEAGGAGGLTARTNFGDVRLSNTIGNPITAGSDSGDVDVELDRLIGPVTATTKFGDVGVTLPAGAGADASLVTRFGSISGPFATGTGEVPEPGKPVTGRIGAGGPRVTLSTDSGDARLTIAGAAR